MFILRIIMESFAQAYHQLVGNRLRSFLSLLGITIGIFCIVGVQSAVDSLEASIRDSLGKLGDNVVYIQKMPWNEDPGNNWWKYMQRPNPDFEDYEALRGKLTTAAFIDHHVFLSDRTAKWNSNSVERVPVVGVTEDFGPLFQVGYEKGRYFSPGEINSASQKALIGSVVAEQLFGAIEPIGKKISLLGKKLEVIGVFEKSGDAIVNVMNYDEVIIISYNLAQRLGNVKSDNPFGGSINIKAKDGVSLVELQDDITGVLRAHRRLRPREDADFSINSVSMLSAIMDNVFSAMNLAAWFIGGFAIFVGMFSVANIMFVSVKERTSIIGVKMALGARSYVILLEFLIESIVLCLIGGAAGLVLIWAILSLLSGNVPFEIFLSANNMVFGLILSVIIGMLAGFIPAFQAARMDPVEAIRQ